MGEEDEDNPRNPSSKGSIPRARPPRTPKPQTNEPGPSRPRPGRAQRQQRRNAAESSAPTTVGPSPSTTLNPAAADFVPGQQVFVTPSTVVVAEQTPSSSTGGRSSRGRPRGGRRGKQPEKKNGNENENGRVESVGTSVRPTGRPRKNENVKLRVQPKIIKESEDLMLRMTEALTKGEYDCSICTDSVFYP